MPTVRPFRPPAGISISLIASKTTQKCFDMGKVLNDPDATLAEQAEAHVGTLDLTGAGLCVGEGAPFVNQDDEGYEFNDDPAPDLVDMTPDGSRIVVSFRGPHPVTVKHAALGSCPGFGVVTLDGDGATGTLTHVFRTFLSDADRHEKSE